MVLKLTLRFVMNKHYANFFRERLEELTSILKNRPQVGIFHSERVERFQMQNLIIIYNLNLKLLRIFDPEEKRMLLA